MVSRFREPVAPKLTSNSILAARPEGIWFFTGLPSVSTCFFSSVKNVAPFGLP